MNHSTTILLFLLLVAIITIPVPRVRATTTNVYFSTFSGGVWSTPTIAVAGITANATGNPFQRTVFYDGSYYFVFFWNRTCRTIQHVSSADGTTWSAAMNASLLGILTFAKYPLGGWDITPSRQATNEYALSETGSDGQSVTWCPFNTTGATTSWATGGALAGGTTRHSNYVTSKLDGARDMQIYERSVYVGLAYHTIANANPAGTSTGVPYGATSGGAQLLTYQTSGLYNCLAIAKGGDNKLYSCAVNGSSLVFMGSWTELATLGAGFESFCATTEAQSIGASEIVHVAYVNSVGSLIYRSYSSDAWSPETAITTNATDPTITYPTLAVDDSGNLVLTYVKNSRIYYRTKTPTGSWSSEGYVGSQYGDSFGSAAYLSSSQYVQNGEIMLVWTGVDVTYLSPEWQEAALWYQFLQTRGWQSVTSWAEYLQVRSWQTVSSWMLMLINMISPIFLNPGPTPTPTPTPRSSPPPYMIMIGLLAICGLVLSCIVPTIIKGRR